jgi:hypothetical protein
MSDLYDKPGHPSGSKFSKQVPQAVITSIVKFDDFGMRRHKVNVRNGNTLYTGLDGTGVYDIKDGEILFSENDSQNVTMDPFGEVPVLSSLNGMGKRTTDEKELPGSRNALMNRITLQGVSYTDKLEDDQGAQQITTMRGGAVPVWIHSNFMPGDTLYAVPPLPSEYADPVHIQNDLGNPQAKVTLKVRKIAPADAATFFHKSMTLLLENRSKFDAAMDAELRPSQALKKSLQDMTSFARYVVVMWEYVKARREHLAGDDNGANIITQVEAKRRLTTALRYATGLRVINPTNEAATSLTAAQRAYYDELGKELDGAVFWNNSTNLMFGKIGAGIASDGVEGNQIKDNAQGQMITAQKNSFSAMVASFLQFDEQMRRFRLGTAMTAGRAGERGTVRLCVT